MNQEFAPSPGSHKLNWDCTFFLKNVDTVEDRTDIHHRASLGWAVPGWRPEGWWGRARFRWSRHYISRRRTLGVSGMGPCGNYVVPSTKKEDQTGPLHTLSSHSHPPHAPPLHLPHNMQTYRLPSSRIHTDFLALGKVHWACSCGLSTGVATRLALLPRQYSTDPTTQIHKTQTSSLSAYYYVHILSMSSSDHIQH